MASKLKDIRQQTNDFKKVTVLPSVEFTPELAGELLQLNNANRPLRNDLVKHYSDQMKAGEWMFAGGTVNISNAGMLLDGQHRLEAIIRTGMSQIFNIQTGLDNMVFQTLDTGRMRTASDTAYVAGFTKDYTNVARLIRLIIMYEKFGLEDYLANKERLATNAQLMNWIYAHEKEKKVIQETVRRAHSYYDKVPFISMGWMSLLLYVVSKKNPQGITTFLDQVTNKDQKNISQHPNLRAIRTKFYEMSVTGKRSQLRTGYKLAVVIKAWNLWLKNYKMSRLDWSENEGFPGVIMNK